MRDRISWIREGAIGVALVLSTVAVIGPAPAYGLNASAKSVALAKDEQQEQHAIAKLKTDVAHLDQDLAALPPEINSVRMYAGAGSGPLLAAAAAWDGLAAELAATASSYESITAGLASESWSGSASSATAAAASPYVAWMQTAAQQAETAAAQAKAEAVSFERSQKGSAPGS